jgi:hypothetical protein
MMIDNDLSTLTDNATHTLVDATPGSYDMTAFPYSSGQYVLHGHTHPDTGDTVNYLATNQSGYYYWCDSLGTLTQGAKVE